MLNQYLKNDLNQKIYWQKYLYLLYNICIVFGLILSCLNIIKMLLEVKHSKVKWLFFLVLALSLNFLTLYAITYHSNSKQYTLQLSLQNQDASTFLNQQNTKQTSLGLFSRNTKETKTKQNKTEQNNNAQVKSKSQSQVIYKANIKNQTDLKYPQSALERELEGKVILHILVNQKGVPVEVKLADSSGFTILDKAAIKSARSWVFEPLNVTEQNVKFIWIKVAIDFKIKNENKV